MGIVVQAIDQALEAGQDKEFRSHLGASSIGEACPRKIWYAFRWATPVTFKASTLRLFNRGHLEEDRFVGWLRQAGVTVYQENPETGKQFRFIGYKGHYGGEIDGVGVGVLPGAPYLLEFKTHNEKSFKDLVSNGVEMSKPTHYIQMQMYMGEYKLTRALYLAIDKNSDSLYDEVVAFNKTVYTKYLERAKHIVDAVEPPPKINTSPSWYECKWCDHHGVCHLKAPPAKNCRTCCHSTPVGNSQWVCEKSQPHSVIEKDLMKTGCQSYVAHPME